MQVQHEEMDSIQLLPKYEHTSIIERGHVNGVPPERAQMDYSH